MVVGKTSSSISKTEIFSKFTEAEVLSTVFPQITSLPCLINSPLRADNHPSFSIYVNDNSNIRYKDHATNERGSLLDLLCRYWNCNFTQALEKIWELMPNKKNLEIKPKQIRMLTRKEYDQLTKIQVVVRPWRDYDYAYWESYGITKKWLKYAEVYPISHKIVTKWEKQGGKSQKYIFTADSYAYCFVERKEGNLSLKIYQPFNTKGFKWCSKMDGSVVSLWTKVPQKGDKIVICSSLKDALCLSCQLHIPAIALQGEGYNISETAQKELRRRFKRVYICFDTDKPGIQDSTALAEKTGFTNIIPDLGESKDLSDYYKSLDNKEDFKQLEKLFY